MPMISDDMIDFSVYEAVTDHKQKVRPASFYVQAMLDRLDAGVVEKQVFMPWVKTRDLIQFRSGEVTVWGGANGSGKSLVTGQAALSLCAQGEKVCVCSFEMKPTKTLERMGRQFTGYNLTDVCLQDEAIKEATVQLYKEFRDWTDTRMWIYDQQGTVEWKKVCGVARYCAKELGITHFFIDNLMKCVAGEDDYNGQKAFIDELCSIARDEQIHIHIIHHVKKPPNEDQKPGKYDFKGTGAITDQVDNVIGVWRNKKKERAMYDGMKYDEKEPDTALIVDKQRNGEGWEGNIALWYEKQSQQYLPNAGDEPMRFYYDGA